MKVMFYALAMALTALLVTSTLASPPPPQSENAYLFCYFADPHGKDGLRLAWSNDGLKWQALNDNRGMFEPTIGDKIFRDPCILRGPDGTYHLLWTTGWNGRVIGYSSSTNLVNWTPQKELKVMGNVPGAMNCWAPEAIYDSKRGEFVIIWSSTIEGRFLNTQAKGDKYNNRIYACTTKDFQTFSEPHLFFDPGYMVIDATITPINGRYMMVFKDETLDPVPQKNLRVAWSDDAQGPYGEISPPFSPPIWVEGPGVLPTGDNYIVYYDAYRAKPAAYGGMRTKDFKTFTDISKDISFPRGTKHGTAFKVPRSQLDALRAHYQKAAVAPDPNPFGNALIPDLVADPSIVEFDGMFYCYATTDGEGKHLSTSGLPVVWKSRDFLNWSFKGSIFPPGFNGKYWAPSSPILRDGTYYLYPTINEKLTVVTASSPEGPFLHPETHSPGWKVITTKAGGSIDAEVLIDDDDQGYMVWQRRGFGKMRADLLDLEETGQIVLPAKRAGYAEGQYILKRKGIYYFLYTQGGDEAYQYAYMMSTGINGPWTAPEHDIIATTDRAEKIFGPGHGSFVNPKGSEQWYFVYLEYGRGSTNRQIYADKMNFNEDGTIQPIKLSKAGIGAVRPVTDNSPNLALGKSPTASSTMADLKVNPRKAKSLARTETYLPANVIDGSNGSRWLAAAEDSAPWWQIDLGSVQDIKRTEAYFVRPTVGHAYKLESSLDGQTWETYGGHEDVIIQSPHADAKAARARYLRLTFLKGNPGLWEFRVY